MQTTPDLVTVAFRELGEDGLWCCGAGEPEPAAQLHATSAEVTRGDKACVAFRRAAAGRCAGHLGRSGVFHEFRLSSDFGHSGRCHIRRDMPIPDISRTGSAADQIRVCSQTLKSAKAVVVARLQRHHPHPEHCLVADIDIVLARERQLAVIANTEHRQARRYCPYRIAIPHIHRQIVLRHQ